MDYLIYSFLLKHRWRSLHVYNLRSSPPDSALETHNNGPEDHSSKCKQPQGARLVQSSARMRHKLCLLVACRSSNVLCYRGRSGAVRRARGSGSSRIGGMFGVGFRPLLARGSGSARARDPSLRRKRTRRRRMGPIAIVVVVSAVVVGVPVVMGSAIIATAVVMTRTCHCIHPPCFCWGLSIFWTTHSHLART